MNISSIYSQRALTVMQGIFSNSSNQTDQSGLDQLNQTVIAKYYGTATTDTSNISELGQVLSRLQKLRSTDPSEFKTLITAAASKLSTAATKAGINTKDGKTLNAMAKSFQDVANGASLAKLHTFVQQSLASQQILSTGSSFNTVSSNVSTIISGILNDLQ